VTVSCGQSACGSDYQMYACSASGWTLTGPPCGGLDAGACECNGTDWRCSRDRGLRQAACGSTIRCTRAASRAGPSPARRAVSMPARASAVARDRVMSP